MTTNIYDMADTWNNGATTFTAIKMNVTDTASNAASLLIDLQVGSNSKFNVRKDGQIQVYSHMLWPTDNTYDIGASGATRPRNIYAGGNISAGGILSAGTSISAGAYVTSSSGGFICANTEYIGSNSRGGFLFPADGVITVRDAANTSFGRLQFGGTTSSFPALKRSTTEIVVRLADDSDFATLALGTASSALKVGTHSAIGAETVTGFITIKDSGGTDRKIAVVS